VYKNGIQTDRQPGRQGKVSHDFHEQNRQPDGTADLTLALARPDEQLPINHQLLRA
jgi:hypothetical protein